LGFISNEVLTGIAGALPQTCSFGNVEGFRVLTATDTSATPGPAPLWTPTSWQTRPVQQAIHYPDPGALATALARIQAYPPLVTSWEIERLRSRIAEAAAGRQFIMQGGDCAEVFDECRPEILTSKLKILLQMSLVLTDGVKCPIIRVGRFAGQYAKPRSSPTETRDGVMLPSYFGDLINSAGFTSAARQPDPERLVAAYQHAALTLNFIRALVEGGFADLHHPEYWDLDFLGKSGLSAEARENYQRRVAFVGNAIELMEILTGQQMDQLTHSEFYTSHEGLSLAYETALTRRVPRRPGWYNLGCHLPWIGERTRAVDGAHVEYFRGIRNPVGVKIGPDITTLELVRLLDVLDANREPGDLVLIARLGASKVRARLPELIAAVAESGHQPAWMCDPMHGNTVSTRSGRKTRHVDAILSEVLDSIDLHLSTGSWLAGVHCELTAESVTECLGGASGVQESDLDTAYQTLCDPRLNYEQAMEVAFAIAKRLEGRNPRPPNGHHPST
jgi:3-deoxy-7-phosphoheptulonate synthase